MQLLRELSNRRQPFAARDPARAYRRGDSRVKLPV
jgi:hypothetical protein